MSIKHESITSATCVWRAVSVPLEILVWKRSGYCGYVCGEVFLDLRAQVVWGVSYAPEWQVVEYWTCGLYQKQAPTERNRPRLRTASVRGNLGASRWCQDRGTRSANILHALVPQVRDCPQVHCPQLHLAASRCRRPAIFHYEFLRRSVFYIYLFIIIYLCIYIYVSIRQRQRQRQRQTQTLLYIIDYRQWHKTQKRLSNVPRSLSLSRPSWLVPLFLTHTLTHNLTVHTHTQSYCVVAWAVAVAIKSEAHAIWFAVRKLCVCVCVCVWMDV